MQSADLPSPAAAAAFSSPKRKRDLDEMDDVSPSAIRIRTDLPCRPSGQDPTEGGSPRTTVAGRLQGLDLDDSVSMTKISFRGSSEDQTEPSSTENQTGDPDMGTSLSFTGDTSQPEVAKTTPMTTAGLESACIFLQTQAPLKTLAFELPETPQLKPSIPASHRTISPLSTPSRRKSPPPPFPASASLSWQESEITGHDPQDLLDDGYGINGIGFRPTPAMAYARAQRRKQQVAEWKSREAREARQKRSEQRRLREGSLEGSRGARVEGMRRVRFQVEG